MHIIASYALLAMSFLLAFFQRSEAILTLSIGITTAFAYYQKLITLKAVIFMGIFACISLLYFRVSKLHTAIKGILFIVLAAMLYGVIFHIVPGFHNLLLFNQIKLSALSKPYSMYLNFDKAITALILYNMSVLHKFERSLTNKDMQQTLLFLVVCIIVILGPAFGINYVKFDPKLHSSIFLWSVNNLFFVCMADAIIFNGFLQNVFKRSMAPQMTTIYLHVILAAIFFGLTHYRGGGWIYVGLATVCGLFYGSAYERTNRLLSPVIVHFGLNLCHYIFFTYPSLARIAKS